MSCEYLLLHVLSSMAPLRAIPDVSREPAFLGSWGQSGKRTGWIAMAGFDDSEAELLSENEFADQGGFDDPDVDQFVAVAAQHAESFLEDVCEMDCACPRCALFLSPCF